MTEDIVKRLRHWGKHSVSAELPDEAADEIEKLREITTLYHVNELRQELLDVKAENEKLRKRIDELQEVIAPVWPPSGALG